LILDFKETLAARLLSDSASAHVLLGAAINLGLTRRAIKKSSECKKIWTTICLLYFTVLQ
jgi:hypothetical protein